ncbi:Hypothetical_protein [Hexamita inflata]|uniref:Hypothetical_protein n=1 Tax=Hexamita inflata TaxID=28002 RepID=A0AA86NFQ8_9EUKA|nr:Hypothetical protein HINF_LOCUS6687 [Hexamita inflata]
MNRNEPSVQHLIDVTTPSPKEYISSTAPPISIPNDSRDDTAQEIIRASPTQITVKTTQDITLQQVGFQNKNRGSSALFLVPLAYCAPVLYQDEQGCDEWCPV